MSLTSKNLNYLTILCVIFLHSHSCHRFSAAPFVVVATLFFVQIRIYTTHICDSRISFASPLITTIDRFIFSDLRGSRCSRRNRASIHFWQHAGTATSLVALYYQALPRKYFSSESSYPFFTFTKLSNTEKRL